MKDLVFQSAKKLARLIRTRKLSAVEVMRAHIAQIERVNPKVNAIVTFLPEAALKEAKKLDAKLARAKTAAGIGPLAGLPIAYKDMISTKGIRTTFGSPIYKDNVPDADHLLVERLRGAGAITLGKTNTPEFAAGSQTFNKVFGATPNPYDLTMTCGGSSGGAAVAVACGMLPFADGSDLGARLRNPGHFCNVVGFRPTPGRTPYYPSSDAWATLSVIGPIARSVEDTAFFFSAMAGPDLRSPISITEPGSLFARPLKRNFRKVRVAWSKDLGGLPVDKRVTAVLEKQRKVFESLGCLVEEAEPDLSGSDEAFHVLRAVGFVQKYAPLLEKHRDKLKDTVVWNIEVHEARRAAHCARARAALRRLSPHARVHGALRLPAAAREPGAALPGHAGIHRRDQRREAGQLHRLDEDLLLHHGHQPPGDLGTCGLYRRQARPAGGASDRRQIPR